MSAVTEGFTVASVSGTGPYTITWASTAAQVTGTFGGTVTFPDTSWSEIEKLNPVSFSTPLTLKHLTRTASTGINAGSLNAIVDAARSILDGAEYKATAGRTSNVITVTTTTPHTLKAGDYVRLCESSVATLNVVGTVASVTSSTVFTVSSTGPNTDTVTLYATARQVQVTKTDNWNWVVKTLAAQTTSSDLLQTVVTRAKPAGVLVTYGNI